MSLLYPPDGIEGYSQEHLVDDLVEEAVKDIRSCFEGGAERVQIDFTEGRLAVKLDPSKELLKQLIGVNQRVLSRFSEEEKKMIGVHTCPGGDHDSTHSADVPYKELIPLLTTLDVGAFYMQMATEKNPAAVLKVVAEHLKPHQRLYVGVIDVCDETVETAEVVRDRVLEAAKIIPVLSSLVQQMIVVSPHSVTMLLRRAMLRSQRSRHEWMVRNWPRKNWRPAMVVLP